MKKYLLFISLFVSAFSFGQNVHYDSTINHKVKTDSLKLTNFPLFIGNAVTANIVGDSYAACYRPNSPDTCFINRIATYSALTTNTLAVGGMGIWRMDSVFYYNVNATSPATNTSILISMVGLNDYRRGGNGYRTLAKVNNGYNVLFVNQFMKNFLSGGATATGLTRYGGSTGYSARTVGGKVNTGWLSNVNNDSITYVFTDTTVFWTTVGTDSTYGSSNYSENVNVYIDNVLKGNYHLNNQTDGISDGVYDNKRSPMAFFYTGLSNAQHTLKIVNNTAHSYYLPVDIIGNLVDKSTANPWVLYEIPQLTTTGFATTPNSANSGVINAANSSLDSLVGTWPSWYPIKIIKTNNFYSTVTGFCSDSIHPNNTGDQQLLNAYVSATAVASAAPGNIINQNGYPYWVAPNSSYVPIVANYSGTFIQNQSVSAQTANFYITGTGQANKYLTTGAEIGPSVLQTDAPFVAGTNGAGNPFSSLYYSAGGTNSKLSQWYTDATSIHGALLNDANNSANDWLYLTRTGYVPTALTLYEPLTVTPGSGNSAFNSAGVANTATVNITGTVTGYVQPFYANISASAGVQERINNTSTGSGAYTSIYLSSAGSVTAASPTISFNSTNQSTDWFLGQDAASGDFKLNTGTFFFNGFSSGTNAVTFKKTTGQACFGGTSPDASAILSAYSTTKGFLPPAMTTTQRTAISSPADGLEVYDVTLHSPYWNLNGTWTTLGSGGMTNPLTTTGDIIYSSSGTTPARLGIGSTGATLTVTGGVPAWGPVLANGTFTPVTTALSNVSASSITLATYSRTGNTVVVTVTGTVTPSANTTLTSLQIDLPLTSSTGTTIPVGSASVISSTAISAGTYYKISTTSGTLKFYSTSTSSCDFTINYAYTL